MTGEDQAQPLLAVSNLRVHFPIRRGFLIPRRVGEVKAVDGVNFQLSRGETLGLVGESGSGKTTTGRALVGLAKATSGSIRFGGEEVIGQQGARLRAVRRRTGFVFQDPYAALNPRMTAGDIVGEPLKVHSLAGNKREYRRRVAELLELVGLNGAMINRFPHEFSGGQRQRLGIARALAVNPELVILDEPVSALDVSVQAQIINLLQDLQRRLGLALLFIAHDLSVVRQISHRVAVMYLGKVVEQAPASQLFSNPQHPYTRALMSAVPAPDPRYERSRQRIVLQGEIPSPADPPSGCVFRTRCPIAIDDCAVGIPDYTEVGKEHRVACIRIGTPLGSTTAI